VDCDYGLNLTLNERVAWMKAKGYAFGNHYLPHDANQTARTGATFASDARAAGLANIHVVPPIADVWLGINAVQSIFDSFEFSTPACEIGVKGLKAYESAPDSSSGVVRNTPLHNWASHVADAVRTMGEAEKLGLIPGIVGSRAAARPMGQAVVAGGGW
jgi:hypothetical protein